MSADTAALVERVRAALDNAEHGYKRDAKRNDFYEISVLEVQDALAALDSLTAALAAALPVEPPTPRCPVCEGIDQPGLLHNLASPYCSARLDHQDDYPLPVEPPTEQT